MLATKEQIAAADDRPMMAVNRCAIFRLEAIVLRGLDTAEHAAAVEAIWDIRRSIDEANRFADELRQQLAGQVNRFADEVRQLLAGQSSEIKTLLFPRRI